MPASSQKKPADGVANTNLQTLKLNILNGFSPTEAANIMVTLHPKTPGIAEEVQEYLNVLTTLVLGVLVNAILNQLSSLTLEDILSESTAIEKML